jgi:hypothetical protein
MSDAPVELADRHSRPKRLILGLLGLFVLVWPIWDLWPGIASFTPVSPIFWIIGLGAAALGLLLLLGSAFGRSTVLTITADGASLEEANLFRRSIRPIITADLGALKVEAQEWSEGPMTWRVSLERKGRKPLVSESLAMRDAAEDLARRIAGALGRTFA